MSEKKKDDAKASDVEQIVSRTMTDDECKILAAEMFIRSVGIKKAAEFIASQQKTIDGLTASLNKFADYFIDQIRG